MPKYNLHQKAAAFVRDAGGELVGRTRLQKVVYLSQLAGFEKDFDFEYRHYGPFSADLADAMEIATGLRLAKEEEHTTDWGGWYSIFKTGDLGLIDIPIDAQRVDFLVETSGIDAIELELAATAAFFFLENQKTPIDDFDPWKKTEKFKPEKSKNGKLAKAKIAYGKLQRLSLPVPLPAIV